MCQCPWRRRRSGSCPAVIALLVADTAAASVTEAAVELAVAMFDLPLVHRASERSAGEHRQLYHFVLERSAEEPESLHGWEQLMTDARSMPERFDFVPYAVPIGLE